MSLQELLDVSVRCKDVREQRSVAHGRIVSDDTRRQIEGCGSGSVKESSGVCTGRNGFG